MEVKDEVLELMCDIVTEGWANDPNGDLVKACWYFGKTIDESVTLHLNCDILKCKMCPFYNTVNMMKWLKGLSEENARKNDA